MWGYKPIPGATTPEAEKKTLDEWARQQDATPWLRFSTEGSAGTDPGELTEAVGDQDAVLATTLGLKNLERVAAMLVPATTTKAGEPFSDLEEVYGRLLGQWSLEMNHVAAIVGGYNSQQKHIGQNGVRFELIPRARQEAAVKFLNDNAFKAPVVGVERRRPAPHRTGRRARSHRGEPDARAELASEQRAGPAPGRTGSARRRRRLCAARLPGRCPHAACGPRSTQRRARRIDAYRRNLQRAYIETLGNRVNGAQAQSDDARAFFRGELKTLDGDLTTAAARQTDRATLLHIADVRTQIARALDPTVQTAPGAARTGTELSDESLFDVSSALGHLLAGLCGGAAGEEIGG